MCFVVVVIYPLLIIHMELFCTHDRSSIRRMHIMIVTPLFPPDLGRVALYTREFATRLASHHDVSIMMYGSFPEDIPGVRYSIISKDWAIPLRMIAFTFRLWRASRGVDVLYVQDGASVGFSSLLVARIRRIPYIRYAMEDEARERSIHAENVDALSHEKLAVSTTSNIKIRLVRWLQRIVLQNAVCVVVPTLFLQEALVERNRMLESNVHIIPFPPEREEILPFLIQKVPHQILITSSLNDMSGVDELVAALPVLVQAYPSLRVIFASDGPLRTDLTKRIHGMGLMHHVAFLGFTSRVEKWALRRSSTVLVMNQSISEGPAEILNAYTAQLPVIATDIPEHRVVMQPDCSGLLIPLHHQQALVQSIERVLNDADLRNALVHGGVRFFDVQISWECHLKAIVQLCEESYQSRIRPV